MSTFKYPLNWKDVALAVVLCAPMVWTINRIFDSERQAEKFCASIKVGQSIDGIAERALASGAWASQVGWSGPSDARVMKAWYDRQVCLITASGDVVTSTSVTQGLD
jgi:hypothetical protein